jgi:hypothetical protein
MQTLAIGLYRALLISSGCVQPWFYGSSWARPDPADWYRLMGAATAGMELSEGRPIHNRQGLRHLQQSAP